MSPITNTPGSFIGRNRQEVSKRLLQRLPQLTDMTYQGEGSIVRAIMETVAMELGNAYSIVGLSWTQQLVATATGASLDSLGMLYGVSRRQISYEEEHSSFYFYLASSPTHQAGVPNMVASQGFTIPQGTLVTVSDDVVGDTYAYSTTSSVVFSQGDSIHYVTIAPVEGTMTKNMAPHTLRFHNYDGTGAANVYCTNPLELKTDVRVESDEEFRARIVQGVRSIASATTTAIRMAALSVDHVRDAKVFDRPYGPATTRVIVVLDSGGTNNTLIAVRGAVDTVRPAGSLVTVDVATTIPINIKYGFKIPDTVSSSIIQASIEVAIKSYIARLGIGQGFSRGMLLQRMASSAPTAIDVYLTGLEINGRTFIGESFKVPDQAVLVLGTLTQTT
jgi:phage-related baseplate assembly protein